MPVTPFEALRPHAHARPAGYWNDPAATAQSVRAGWYHTGDWMRRGEGNELWFMARKKDIIIAAAPTFRRPRSRMRWSPAIRP